MLNRSSLRFEVEPGFALGIVLTTPPFPYDRESVDMPVGIPILFEGNLSPSERRHVHYGEVGIKHGVLVTSGMSGYTLVVTGAAETIEAARDAANALADKVLVANARYRRDIGAQLIECDLSKIESWGMLDTD